MSKKDAKKLMKEKKKKIQRMISNIDSGKIIVGSLVEIGNQECEFLAKSVADIGTPAEYGLAFENVIFQKSMLDPMDQILKSSRGPSSLSFDNCSGKEGGTFGELLYMLVYASVTSLSVKNLHLTPKEAKYIFDWIQYNAPEKLSVKNVKYESNRNIIMDLFGNMDDVKTRKIRITSLRMLEIIGSEVAFRDTTFIETIKGGTYSTLRTLSFRNCTSEDWILLFETLEQHQRLTSLDLSGTNISEKELDAMFSMLRINTLIKTLTLEDINELFTEQFFRNLKGVHLTRLSIGHYGGKIDENFREQLRKSTDRVWKMIRINDKHMKV